MFEPIDDHRSDKQRFIEIVHYRILVINRLFIHTFYHESNKLSINIKTF